MALLAEQLPWFKMAATGQGARRFLAVELAGLGGMTGKKHDQRSRSASAKVESDDTK